MLGSTRYAREEPDCGLYLSYAALGDWTHFNAEVSCAGGISEWLAQHSALSTGGPCAAALLSNIWWCRCRAAHDVDVHPVSRSEQPVAHASR